jgi:hypothetical protein
MLKQLDNDSDENLATTCSKSPSLGLNPNHKRALSAALREVEEELMTLRRLLLKAEVERLFFHINDDLTQDEKQKLIEKIEFLTNRLGSLKNLFGLEPGETVQRWIVRATAVYLSIQLEEIKSDRLKGYGEVPSEAKDILDPALNEMILIIREMGSAV